MCMPDNTNPVGSKANPMRMDMPDNAKSLVQRGSWRTDNPLYNSTSVQNIRSEVRPNELTEPSNAHETNQLCPSGTAFELREFRTYG